MKPRLKKKSDNLKVANARLLEWLCDFRLFLMEAIEDGSCIQLIRRQFKERYTKGGIRKSDRYFKSTTMNRDFKMVMGNAWAIEGLR